MSAKHFIVLSNEGYTVDEYGDEHNNLQVLGVYDANDKDHAELQAAEDWKNTYSPDSFVTYELTTGDPA